MKRIHPNKIIGCLLGIAMMCTLAACGTPSTQQTASSSQSQVAQSSSQGSLSEAPQSSEATSSSESNLSQASQVPQSNKTISSSESGSSQAAQAPQSSAQASKPEVTQPSNTTPASEGAVMVVYFSATGNTKAVAEVIAAATDGELYEIIPETPYTSDDLNWNEPTSRTNKEHEDPSIRPAIAGDAKDLSGYDTVFIGYPLWWGEAPNIVWNFIESSDLSEKTVIPFATSSSSGFGSSGETLKGFAPDANWLDGQRFRSGAPETDVQSWVSGLKNQ